MSTTLQASMLRQACTQLQKAKPCSAVRTLVPLLLRTKRFQRVIGSSHATRRTNRCKTETKSKHTPPSQKKMTRSVATTHRANCREQTKERLCRKVHNPRSLTVKGVARRNREHEVKSCPFVQPRGHRDSHLCSDKRGGWGCGGGGGGRKKHLRGRGYTRH